MENAIKIFKSILDNVSKALSFLWALLLKILYPVWEKFLDSTLSEKAVFLNCVAGFFAVIIPVARFYIFESYFYINNPLSVYMIAIIIIMFGSLYFTGFARMLTRVIINLYYLFWIIYLPLAGELTKAEPHEICTGYYLNIAVPVVFIAASLFSYYIDME